MAKYLVTGGAGFIGSHVTDLLITAGHEVIVLDDLSNGTYVHPDAVNINASILSIKSIEKYFKNIDGIFHLAALPIAVVEIDSWFSQSQVNLQGSLNIFKIAILCGGIPVVYASSCAIYGEQKKLPITENTIPQPISAYGCDKLSVEKNAYFLAKNYKFPNIGLRLFNVYGPRQNPNSPYSGVISKFIFALINDQSPIIFGSGEQTRDFIYVKDVAQAFVHGMEIINNQAEIVNICTGVETSINQLANQLCVTTKKHLPITYTDARSSDTIYSYGSTDKMSKLGFNIKYSLQTGLQETVDFFVAS